MRAARILAGGSFRRSASFSPNRGYRNFLTGRRLSASASCAQGRRRGNPLRCSKPSGMNFALSTDANHGGVAYEGIYAAMGGMPNEEALAGLTVHGARLCGKLDEIGVLK